MNDQADQSASDREERAAVDALPEFARPHYELDDGFCVTCGEPWMCSAAQIAGGTTADFLQTDISTALRDYLAMRTDVSRPSFNAMVIVHHLRPFLAAVWDDGARARHEADPSVSVRNMNPYRDPEKVTGRCPEHALTYCQPCGWV